MKKYIFAITSLLLSFSAYADIDAVACRGKIVPGSQILRLAASSPAGTAILQNIYIKQGDAINKDQIVAELKGIDKAIANEARAKASLDRAKNLHDLKILQQENLIKDMQGTFDQNTNVIAKKDPPRREREQIEYDQESIARRIAQEKEVLPLLKASEEAMLKEIESAYTEAQAHTKEFRISAPISGEIIAVHSKVGEAVSPDGICELADTNTMFVEAEVYESDITKIKVGATVHAKNDALKGEVLTGTVMEISPSVRTNKMVSTNPSDFTNMRVILVKIKLDQPEKVKNLIGSQVDVRILK